jgi:hypothetical protein
MKLLEEKSISKKMGSHTGAHSRPQIPHRFEEATMLYKIDYDRALDYISLSVSGALNISEARACRDQLQEVLRICDRTRVLIDTTNVIAKLSAVEDYKFIKELSDGSLLNVSMALIVFRERVPFGLFIDTTTVNKGVRLRTFTDKNEALAWLMKQPSGVPDRRMCRAS